MTPQERQDLLNNAPEEDLAKIQAKTDKIPVYIEDLLEAEFLRKFGWSAYSAIYPDYDPSKGITGRKMMTLLAASRRLDLLEQYRDMQSSFVGTGASNSKSPSNSFEKMTQKIVKQTEADK